MYQKMRRLRVGLEEDAGMAKRTDAVIRWRGAVGNWAGDRVGVFDAVEVERSSVEQKK
jgi:hypothetical protein